MKLPNRLPIARVADYHTHYLGRAADGTLFWAYKTFVFDKGYLSLQPGEDWQKFRKEYVVMHTFTKKGDHLTTKHWYAGLTASIDQRAVDAKLGELVAELGPVVFGDIKIKLFQTHLENTLFGLVVDEEYELIHLQPSATISFQAPWDGEYLT